MLLLNAGVLDGTLHVIHSAAKVGFSDRRWFESALAVAVKLARETCALCGEAPATRLPRVPSAPAGVRVCSECSAELQTTEWQELDAEWRSQPVVEQLLTSESPVPQTPISAKLVKAESLVVKPVAAHVARRPAIPSMASDLDTPLPPEQLRELWAKLLAAMQRRIAGNEDAVRRLALIGALHVGAAPDVGARVLVLGSTGSGKTHAMASFIDALSEVGYPVVVLKTDVGAINAPGWSKAPSIGELVLAALGARSPTEPKARRAVVLLEELHHSRVRGDADSSSRLKREEVLASLLGLVAGDHVPLGEKTDTWSARQALVFAAGAFTGLDLSAANVTPARLSSVGIPPELANRLCSGDIVEFSAPPKMEIARVLGAWPELVSLTSTARHLGFTLRIPEATLHRASELIMDGRQGDTFRSAGGAIVSAARQHLLTALEKGARRNEIVVTPDDIRTARPPRPSKDLPRDPPEEFPMFR